MNKLLTIFVILFILIIGAVPATMVYMLHEPMPFNITERSLKETNVPQGGSLKILGKVTFFKTCIIRTQRFVIDANRKNWDLSKTLQSPYDPQFSINVPIPKDIAIGQAELHSVVEWECNFVQNYFPGHIPLSILYFTVTEASAS
jgi:hypothetical protein